MEQNTTYNGTKFNLKDLFLFPRIISARMISALLCTEQAEIQQLKFLPSVLSPCWKIIVEFLPLKGIGALTILKAQEP